MVLIDALKIGQECALNTVGEAIYNIDLRAGQIFEYNEISKELHQLYSEWNIVKTDSGFTSGTSIADVSEYLKKKANENVKKGEVLV